MTPDDVSYAYELRVSSRARRVRLEISQEKGLLVVVPQRFKLAGVPNVLQWHRDWIRSTFARLAHRPSPSPRAPWRIPAEIALRAIGTTWQVSARSTDVRWVAVHESRGRQLTLAGQTTEERACREGLGRWLVRQARMHLPPRLGALSQQTGLRYGHVSVRRQKTRWGSCARGGQISLNARLLFLPPELVDYVCVHELCHGVHSNHSTAFWTLVHRHCPEAPSRRAELQAAGPFVPYWA